jgi:hypothetical protein
MTTWLLAAAGALLAAVIVRLAMPTCAHVDEDGRSLLTWECEPGRVFGRCAECGRVTSGWSVSWEAAYRSPLKASPASRSASSTAASRRRTFRPVHSHSSGAGHERQVRP